MDVRNCKGCGRLFNYLQGPPLCPGCIGNLEDKFQQVKAFLRENPNAPLGVVAEENDVSAKQIRQWVREERLTFTEESQITLECEGCGASILTGRYCSKCKNGLISDLNGAVKRPQATLVQQPQKGSEKDRMRFLEK